jgi:hypothetical protein
VDVMDGTCDISFTYVTFTFISKPICLVEVLFLQIFGD